MIEIFKWVAGLGCGLFAFVVVAIVVVSVIGIRSEERSSRDFWDRHVP